MSWCVIQVQLGASCSNCSNYWKNPVNSIKFYWISNTRVSLIFNSNSILNVEKFQHGKLFLISFSTNPYFILNFWSKGRYVLNHCKFELVWKFELNKKCYCLSQARPRPAGRWQASSCATIAHMPPLPWPDGDFLPAPSVWCATHHGRVPHFSELIQKMGLPTLGFSEMGIQHWASLEWHYNSAANTRVALTQD
jgi:hypothetical protein